MKVVTVKDTIVYWFRRDLRISDSKGLFHACKTGDKIIPLFIIDEDFLPIKAAKQNNIRFILSSLRELDKGLKKLGSKLIIKRGKSLDVLKDLVRDYNVRKIYFNRNYYPREINRDKEIWNYFKNSNVKIKSYKDFVLHEKTEIKTNEGKPYKVFTPYYRKWANEAKDRMIDTPGKIDSPNIETLDIENFLDKEIQGGEFYAKKTLDRFVKDNIYLYELERDYPIKDRTSKLSVHLSTGTISIREVYHRVKALYKQNFLDENLSSIQSFVRQLAWRDFYYQIIYNFPRVEKEAFLKTYKDITWNNNMMDFESWKAGKTGYPFIDAGMRQLIKEGYMHNRLRMITASFLTKDLLINWQLGEEYFKEKLLDYDLALNNGGWQWSASTGTDAQPYFRIFNPISQSKKFDAEGEFIRKYVPELKDVPTKYIHQPSKMPIEFQKKVGCIIGRDYPYPIVDHSIQRKLTLEIYGQAKSS